MNRSDAFLLHVDERPPLTVMRYLVTWREDDGEARGKGWTTAANAYAQEAEDYMEEATGVARQSEDPVALAMVEVADVRRQSVAYGVSPSSQAVRLADLLAKLIEVAP